MNFKIKKNRKGFSLIELMIVIVILGALVAIILPQFNASESEAKDVGCDASNYGTLRQLSNFKSINGVYPSRMHTGYETDGGNAMGNDPAATKLAAVTASNFVANCSQVSLDDGQAESLAQAGITVLANGGFGIDPDFQSVSNGVSVAAVSGPWYEDAHKGGAEEPVTINGLPIWAYSLSDPQVDYTVGLGVPAPGAGTDLVVPLFIAPTTDWEFADRDSGLRSRISVAQAGGCPWLEAGEEFRYYIAFFKVYSDGTPATMVGTTCPECGSLNP